MKGLIRNFLLYTVILYYLPVIIPGLHITGGLPTYLIGGAGLTFIFLVIKPILNFISFPINLLTLGLFSVLTNGLIIYLLTIVITGITIMPFTYPRTDLRGFITPPLQFDLFFAYIYTAFVLSFIDSFIKWLMR